MLDTYVSDMSNKQKLRSLVDMESFSVKLQEEVAMEDTERQLKIQEFIDQSADHKNKYESNFNRIGSIIAEFKTK